MAGYEEAAIGSGTRTANVALIDDGYVIAILSQVVSAGDADMPGTNDNYLIRPAHHSHAMPLRNGSPLC